MERPRLERSAGRRVFGADPDTYDAARPGHPERVYEILRDRCGLRPGAAVLEIGPGTGQATRRLLELGARPLVAIEPDPALAEYVRGRFGDAVEIRISALEDAKLETGAFDVAAAASSFHWVEEDVGLARLHAALGPGAWLALWWTLFGDHAQPDAWMRAVDPLFVDVPHPPSGGLDGRPSFGLDAELRLAALERAGFEDATHEVTHWDAHWDAKGIRGLYATFSPIASLEPERRAAFLDALEEIAERDFGGVVRRPLATTMYTARRPE